MDSATSRELGKRISRIRRSNKITQSRLAELLGVSVKHISHTESGTSLFSLYTLIEFCNVMNCSMDYIVFGTKSDNILSRLPSPIIDILIYGSKEDIDRLHRYLNMYLDIKNAE